MRARFHHGTVVWNPVEPLRAALAHAGVPDKVGAYVLRAARDQAVEIVYVGRSGTLRNDGTFRNQKLFGRLQAKQEGMSRQAFFRKKLDEGGFTGLRIEWFETWDDNHRHAPALAEAELLQAYLDEHRHLPPWNAEF
jgi:hypothetical protein